MQPTSAGLFVKFRTVEDLDAEITRTKVYLRDLIIERNLRAPVSRIPGEILSHICRLAATRPAYAYGLTWPFIDIPFLDPQSLVCFLSVCHRWYSVVFDNPALWCTISFRDSKQIPVLLERSKKSALSVAWFTLNRAAEGLPQLDDSMELTAVFRQFSRIRHLTLDVEEKAYQRLKSLVPTSLSLLEILSISVRYISSANPSNFHLNVIKAENLQHLRLRGPVVPDLALCEFPRLKGLLLYFSFTDPPLPDILTFISRSPLLQTVALHSSHQSLLATSRVNYGQRPIVCLPHLCSLTCAVPASTSSLLRIVSHLKIPPNTSLDMNGGNILSQPQSYPDSYFQSLWPFPPDVRSPTQLSLTDDIEEFVFTFSTKNAGDTKYYTTWRFLPEDEHAERPSSAVLERLHVTLVGLQQRVCQLRRLEKLECTLEVLPSTWAKLFAPSILVTRLNLRLNAAHGFIAFFTPDIENTNHAYSEYSLTSHFPVLRVLAIAEGGRWYTGVSWTGVLSGLARALEIRAAYGHTLNSFTLNRNSLSCWDPDDGWHPSEDWDVEVAFLDRIRELVSNVKVIDPPDEDESSSSQTTTDSDASTSDSEEA